MYSRWPGLIEHVVCPACRGSGREHGTATNTHDICQWCGGVGRGHWTANHPQVSQKPEGK